MIYLHVKAYLFIKLSYGDTVTTSLISTLRHDVESTFSHCLYLGFYYFKLRFYGVFIYFVTHKLLVMPQ